MSHQNHLDRVRALITRHAGVPETEITLEARLVEDLGIDGDDGHELLAAFADAFDVEMSRMASFNYFDDEPPFSGGSSLIPLVALLNPRFRAYVRHAARGRRPITVGTLVASAELGTWTTPLPGGYDPSEFTWWSRLVLGGSIGFPLALGLWRFAYDGASFADAAMSALVAVAILSTLLGLKFLHSLSYLRRLNAAATFEEQALGGTD